LELTRFRGHSSAWAARLGQEGCPHAENPTPYPPEFRRRAIELVRSGVPIRQVAEELGVSQKTLRISLAQHRLAESLERQYAVGTLD
jgi:transposase-like protein